MSKIFASIVAHNDLRLVALAAIVCAIGAVTTGVLVRHIALVRAERRFRWRVITVLSSALVTWSTQFLGMLAFEPGAARGFAVGTTLLSLALCVAIAWLGIRTTLRARSLTGRAMAGLLLGLTIVTTHYVGMAAFKVAGHLIWNTNLVVASVVAAFGFAVFTSLCRVGDSRILRVTAAPALFFLAAFGAPFLAMSAVTVVADPAVIMPSNLAATAWLTGTVANISGLITVLCVAAVIISINDERRAREEQSRVHSFSDIAVEGLLICDEHKILTNNRSFDELIGGKKGGQEGYSIARLVEHPIRIHRAKVGVSFKTRLCSVSGDWIAVEIIRKQVEYAGVMRNIYAVRDMRDQERADAERDFRASHDGFTGLSNRTDFELRLGLQLDAARIAGRKFAILAVDLDRFKVINDTLGHGAGGGLLVRVAKRLQVAIGPLDLVSHLGGSEFAILMESSEDTLAAVRLADTVVDLLSRPFVIEGQALDIGVSLGVAFAPADADTADQLQRCADMALFRAKEDGQGTYRLFEPGMDSLVQAQRVLETDLRHAAAKHEFALHYQPQLDVRSGRITGFEALIRWPHDKLGMISPVDFIPIAEDIGLISNIGEWVLRTACREALNWSSSLSVAVNLSPMQCRTGRIVEVVAAALAESGLAPARLEVEITEGTLLQDNAESLAVLNAIKALGVRISMDDFGTGYSSLSYLHSFPFDKIKIDRSFVSRAPQDKDARSVVRAIVGLGAGLGMSITAEGVETREQLDFIRAEGCDEVQGYLVSPPMEPTEIKSFLAVAAVVWTTEVLRA
jgi:diguanylate cyclase (GGDEF)-like protein